MTGKNGIRWHFACHVGVFARVCVAITVPVSLTPAGCTDHRKSLAEFVEIEQQQRQVQAPSSSEADLEAIQEMLSRQLGPYRVGPSDVLMVTITGAGETAVFPPVRVRVDRDGAIDLPIVGAVSVAGMELEDVDKAVRKAFVPHVLRDAVAHVEQVDAHRTNVLVVGSVTEPGLVPLRRTERNLLYAIVGAGGASTLASGEVTLRRIRRPTEEVTLTLTDPKELKAALALEPLEDGDIVTVHAAEPNVFFVGGLVNAPRPQEYPPGVQMTVLQTLAAAGGLRTDVSPHEGTLVRRMSDGQDVHVKLDLDRIADGRDPNVYLAAGDILWVPDTWDTRVQDFINLNIFLRAGVSVSYNVSGVEFLNRRSLQGARAGGNLEDSYDPLGFLTRNAALQGISSSLAP
ncbi:MAG: polysaccharide biosynthesis/export family protein [Planctomycetes bacterium]|nr:polysaccharide biosynthesis/export family protein [Planctomycetota bacterium]